MTTLLATLAWAAPRLVDLGDGTVVVEAERGVRRFELAAGLPRPAVAMPPEDARIAALACRAPLAEEDAPVALSPDGRWLAVADDEATVLWDVARCVPVAGVPVPARALGFAGGDLVAWLMGLRVLSVPDLDEVAWRPTGGVMLHAEGPALQVGDLLVDAVAGAVQRLPVGARVVDGRVYAVEAGALVVRDLALREVRRVSDAGLDGLRAVAARGDRFVVTDGVRVLSVGDGIDRWTSSGTLSSVCLGPGGRVEVSESGAGRARALLPGQAEPSDLALGCASPILLGPDGVPSVAVFSAGGGGGMRRRRVPDGVQAWDPDTGEDVGVVLPAGQGSVSDDGRLYAHLEDGTLTLFETATGRPVWSVPARAGRGVRVLPAGVVLHGERSATSLDLATGATLWTWDEREAAFTTAAGTWRLDGAGDLSAIPAWPAAPYSPEPARRPGSLDPGALLAHLGVLSGKVSCAVRAGLPGLLAPLPEFAGRFADPCPVDPAPAPPVPVVHDPGPEPEGGPDLPPRLPAWAWRPGEVSWVLALPGGALAAHGAGNLVVLEPDGRLRGWRPGLRPWRRAGASLIANGEGHSVVLDPADLSERWRTAAGAVAGGDRTAAGEGVVLVAEAGRTRVFDAVTRAPRGGIAGVAPFQVLDAKAWFRAGGGWCARHLDGRSAGCAAAIPRDPVTLDGLTLTVADDTLIARDRRGRSRWGVPHVTAVSSWTDEVALARVEGGTWVTVDRKGRLLERLGAGRLTALEGGRIALSGERGLTVWEAP